MSFIDFYDKTSNIELVLFSDIHEKYKNVLDNKHLYLVKGRVNKRNDRLSIIVDSFERVGS